MSDRPNILIVWGDNVGISDLSCYSDGLMGYRTPPRQEPASFSIDKVMEKLRAGIPSS
jgi:arylsulfatase A-like enzyme